MSAHRFPLSKLSLAVTTALLTGPAALTASLSAQAEPLAPDSQWQCMPNAEGNGWNCGQVNRSVGSKMTAVRPAPKAEIHKPASGTGTAVAAAGAAAATGSTEVAEAGASTESALTAFTTLDWVPREEMTEEQAAKLAPFMSGDYVEPERAGIDFKGDPSGEPIHASADKSRYSADNVAILTGAVSMRQGYRQIESERAELQQDTAEADFEGNVVYREPGMLLVGDTAYVNSETGRLEVSNARYLAHGMRTRGEATELTRQEDQVVVLADGTYTTCKPGCDTWHLEGDTVELDPTSGRGEAFGATLNLADIPVFYFPYVNFPIDDRRHSGFLYPTFAFDSDNGFDYTQPYYINLAPNYDATVTPRLMTDRGLMLESEFRYLTENSYGEIGGAYLYNDDLKDENRNYDESRWFFNYRHQQELAQNWDAEIDFANASDKDYLRDFGTDLDSSAESVLNQQFISTYKGGDLDHLWQLTFNAQAFKNMDLDSDDPYEKLPQLEFAGLYNLSDRINVNYLADVTHFTRDDDWKYLSSYTDVNDTTRYTYGKSDSNELSNADGTRMFLETGVDYNFEQAWGFVRPKLTLRHVQYNLSGMDRSAFGAGAATGTANSQLKYDTAPSTTVPMLSIDAGLYFDRESIWGENNMTQTLEPRMLYVLAPHESGQEQNPLFDTTQPSFSYASLWRERRFSGYDRLGDANQLSVGVESKFFEEDGFERLRMGIGQTFYFRDREVLRDPYWGSDINDPDNDSNITEGRERYLDDQKASTSPLASVLDYRIDPTLTWGNEWIYNTNEGRNDRFTTRLTWSPDEERVINAAYNYTSRVDRTKKDSDGNAIPGQYADGSISQTDLSLLWPVTNNWSAVSRWNYDLTNSRNLELMFGGEREDDCYKLRVVWRTYVDADDDIDNAETKNGLFVQFVLKGFGALGGGKVTSALEQVNGWERREEKRASY